MKNILEKSKFLGLIAVISILVNAFFAFLWGAIKSFKATYNMIDSLGSDKMITIYLIQVIDYFLLALTLLIFSCSLYEMLFGGLNLPSWLLSKNIYELKSKLSNVIILVIIINFLENLIKWENPYETLIFAISVFIISFTLILLEQAKNKK